MKRIVFLTCIGSLALVLTARYLEFSARQRGADAIEALARALPDVALKLRAWPESGDAQTVAFVAWLAGNGASLGALFVFPLLWFAVSWLLWHGGKRRRSRP